MTTAVVLMALTALACGAVVPPSDSVNVVPRESPGATASPPRATDSPSPTAPPEIHVGGLVRIVSSEPLTVRTRPGDGLGEPTRATASPGGTAFVADGPRVRDGRTWWLIREQFTAYGWAPARSADGRDVLEPFVPACPRVEAVTDEDLTRLGGAGSLVCFGNAELRFEATVTCLSAAVDGGPGGVPWRSSRHICHTDTGSESGIGLHGPAITRFVTGGIAGTNLTSRFRIIGHFDDPAAARCWNIPVGIDLSSRGRPDPDAVIDCRQMFVVTEAVRLG